MSALPIDPLSPEVMRVLSRSKEIAAMPQTVFKAMEMAGDETTSTARMEATVMIDPGFSAKILASANSAAYGMPRRVTSIRDAIGLLGFTRVKQIAMTVGAYDMFMGKTDKESLRRRGWWRQSVEVAHVGKYFSAQNDFAHPDQVFAAGLLHLMGKTLLCRFDSNSYDMVDAAVANGVDVIEAEREAYGCDHIEVGIGAGTTWGFPEELVNAMDYVTPTEANAPGEFLTFFVALAHYLVNRHNLPELKAEPPKWALDAIGIDVKELDAYMGVTQTVIDSIVPMG